LDKTCDSFEDSFAIRKRQTFNRKNIAGVAESRAPKHPKKVIFYLKHTESGKAYRPKKKEEKRHFNYGCAIHTSYVDIIAISVSRTPRTPATRLARLIKRRLCLCEGYVRYIVEKKNSISRLIGLETYPMS